MITARPMENSDVPSLSEALARAFANEAVLAWMLPQRSFRTARLREMFRLELETYVVPQEGMIFTAGGGPTGLNGPNGASEGLVGGCLALPPGRWAMPQTVNARTAMHWLWTYGRRLPRAGRTPIA